MDYWAQVPMGREQMTLFSPTLDATIAEDDPVRLFDEVLSAIDWTEWEAEYDGRKGQPPIHPRHVAAVILYGLCRGIRSSRKLEEAACYRLDFVWLLHGLRPDHTTIAKFRTKFAQPLKNLFLQVGKIAMTMGLIRLGEVAFDGTRGKANNGRYKTRTAKTLEEKLVELDAQFERMMAEFQSADRQEQRQFTEEEGSATRLPRPLADLKQRRQKVQEALDLARQRDEARRRDGIDPEQKPAQVPVTDPDCRVMPNKEGGFAPNYTPTATTDGHRGFIVDADVTADVNETEVALESVDRIEEDFGETPERFLTDGGNNSGAIIHEMERRGIEFYAPVESSQPQGGHPAQRDDPTEPVPVSQWEALPRNARGQLDKSCFLYDAAGDRYWCPRGQELPFDKTKPHYCGGKRVQRRVYRCGACQGCPLAEVCLLPQSKAGRTVTRDEFEEARERLATRMASPAGKAVYNQRPRIAETPFGILKSVIGLRQFLLRGLKKVKAEWRWAVTAFNLAKLVRETSRLRAQFAQLAAAGEN